MDIDVQFNEIFQHDSLKELLDIIKKSGKLVYLFIYFNF